jgi:LPS sulfotransferase NodH
VLGAARAQTKLADFGPDSFLPGLRALIASLEHDAKLNAFGRYFAQRQLTELLATRLRLVDWRRRHPEVEKQEIVRPLFVLGLPRTGTTLLYSLLALDPAHRSPLSWEVDDPCPAPEAASYASDPRIQQSAWRFKQLERLAPGIQAIHPVGADLPQECIVVTASEFMSIRFEMTFDVASYQDWLLEADMTGCYGWHKRFLQHLQSRHARERWVLKSPGHLGTIDALLAAYPDARIVQTHRDPRRVVPSVSSLEWTLRGIASDAQDAHALGQQQLRAWSRTLRAGMQARARHAAREQQFADLHFREIARDPIACVRRIYERFGFTYTPEFEQRMRAYVAAHPREEHGAHRYTLEGFGLSAAAVDAAFADYCARFEVQRESE